MLRVQELMQYVREMSECARVAHVLRMCHGGGHVIMLTERLTNKYNYTYIARERARIKPNL